MSFLTRITSRVGLIVLLVGAFLASAPQLQAYEHGHGAQPQAQPAMPITLAGDGMTIVIQRIDQQTGTLQGVIRSAAPPM